MSSEFAEIALVAAQLGQFQQLLKTRAILILKLLAPMRLHMLDILLRTRRPQLHTLH